MFLLLWSEFLCHRSDIGSIVWNAAKSVMLQLERGLSFVGGISPPVDGKRFLLEAKLVRQDNGMGAVACAELGKDVVDMRLDGSLTDKKFRGNFSIVAPTHDQL